MTLHITEVPPSLRELIRVAQEIDPETSEIKTKLSEDSGERALQSDFALIDGLLYHHSRICVPDQVALRQEILRSCHDSPLAGHFGQKRTLQLVDRHFWWEKMRDDVKE